MEDEIAAYRRMRQERFQRDSKEEEDKEIDVKEVKAVKPVNLRSEDQPKALSSTLHESVLRRERSKTFGQSTTSTGQEESFSEDRDMALAAKLQEEEERGRSRTEVVDDEEYARKLQNEFYSQHTQGTTLDPEDGVRAPDLYTTERLVTPNTDPQYATVQQFLLEQ
eukprot:CAMPEP_0115034406 /NCGR_PEP_ID=MMETSP0216-20121206/40627_1 /TAXON_ID=223996 /ORGANISM="Protocruzia adherens, Strain Boccale" /LENGTH=165 /DNA_ID=CAMNT_0002413275 /DNA_START=35 /DNA_END=529 /DNA_ORIENTATION=+